MTTLSTSWDRVVPRHLEPIDAAPVELRPLPTAPHVAVDQTAPQMVVGDKGVIALHESPRAPRERISRVPIDVFFGRLDDIAAAVREAQENDGVARSQGKAIYTDRDGAVLLGGDTQPGERLSHVTLDPFYARMTADEEEEFVRERMPLNTLRLSDGDVEGWHFTITNELGDAYDLFMYWHDGHGCYRVALISPRLDGGVVDAHGTHLWTDGTLCLTRNAGSGYTTMEATYAKAALWTRGASFFRRGHGFQFNVGQSA